MRQKRGRSIALASCALGCALGAAYLVLLLDQAVAFSPLDIADAVVLNDQAIVRATKRDDGATAITVHSVVSGERTFRGETFRGLGRISATTNLSQIVAGTGYECGLRLHDTLLDPFRKRSGFAVVAQAASDRPQPFVDGTVRGRDFASYGGVAALPDGSFLFARAGFTVHEEYLVMVPRRPYGIDRVRFERSVADRPTMTLVDASPTMGRLAVEILPTGVPDVVVLLTDESTIELWDVGTWTMLGDPIRFPAAQSPGHYIFGPRRPVPALHATLAPDGRLVVVNRLFAGDIAAVDLISRTAQTIALGSDVNFVGGVAFNLAWLNAGLLAVHGGDKIAIYEIVAVPASDPDFDAARPYAARERAKLAIERPFHTLWEGDKAVTDAAVGPSYSIAWSATGQYIIAASSEPSGDGDFVVAEVMDGGHRLEARRMLTASTTLRANFPGDIWTANGFLTPSPTPTLTEVPTATATRTATQSPVPPTASVTATSTPLPTATPTPLPAPIYLPLALTESCTPAVRRVDISLVLDASTSMNELTAAGRPKLAAASDAARAFLAALRLDTGDQAAIVTFNAEATLLQTLTSSEPDLHAALDRIATSPQTRIHRGIEVAAAELASPRRATGHTPVMVLLTDGRANPEGPEFAVAEADAVKRAGVTVFTVGLGDDLDHEALRAMASRPEDYHHAPDAEQLAEIYRAIAVTIPCPAERFWGRR